MNRNIIIAILVIIIVAILGFSLFGGFGNGKANTQINFLNDANLQNGEQIQIELKDAQGNALANEIVNFTYQANGYDEVYSVVTNAEGKAFLTLSGEDAGDHQVTVSYGGSDKYNPCTATQTITLGSGDSTSSTETTDTNSTASTVAYDSNASSGSSSSGSSSSSQQYYYDRETGDTYDSNGIIVSGQNEGMSIDYIRNNPQQVENGSLV